MVLNLLTREVDKFGAEDLVAPEGGAEVKWPLVSSRHGFQEQVVLEDAQIIVVQGEAAAALTHSQGLIFKGQDTLSTGKSIMRFVSQPTNCAAIS